MILEKNKHFNEPNRLFLASEGVNFDSVKVLRVTENAPAADAGLDEGDFILQIDGEPTKKFSLEQVRRMFTQKGRTYRLTIERNGKASETKIKLRDLI